jgi:RHS repeat-associated protein
MGNFTVYVNPYLVLKSGGYTKHYYIEGQRIVSKLGGGIDNNGKGPLKAGEGRVDYNGKQQKIRDGIVKNLKFLGLDGAILTAGKSGKVPPGQLNTKTQGGGKNDTESFQYFYHPDHLGSTSYITDASGEVYQHLEYFAFGETFVEEHSNTDRTPYLYNGKELDEETGLYYYGARYYDPRTNIWASVDPLAENNPDKTPYHYVSNNPMNRIDPDGRDDFEINTKGEIVNRIENKKADNFYIVDNDGNRMEGKSISFKYGTVESVRSQKAQYSKRNDDGTREDAVSSVDIYKIRGDKNGTQLFEFVADNTTVEWSHIKTGVEGDKGLNFLTTGHIEYTEPGASALLNGQLQHGYTIREMNHNHPRNTPIPSGVPGLTGEGGDVGFAGGVTDWYQRKYPERSNSPTFNIYIPKDKTYVPFNKNSKKSDFGY